MPALPAPIAAEAFRALSERRERRLKEAFVVASYPGRISANIIRGLSLCSGVGGLDLGLGIAEPGYRTVCHVERSSFPASVLVARMEDQALYDAPIWDDLVTFDGRPWRGAIDLVCAGYPCQPFSSSGGRKGAADPRHLWPQVARIIGETGAEWVFLENVAGHVNIGLDVVVAELSGMGYRVEAGLFSAAEVGASHWRTRVFVLAHAHGVRPDGQNRYQDRPARLELDAVEGQGRASGRLSGSDARLVGGVALSPGDREQPGSPPALSLFPPGPLDLADWDAVLTGRPDLQPCLFGLDDGLAHWVERSEAAGNGVVPLAAALAWTTLRARFEPCFKVD